MSHRMERIDALMREEISRILFREHQERLQMFSVTRVSTKRDLSGSDIYISFFDEPGELIESKRIEYLNECGGMIRAELRKRVRLKRLPALRFVRDKSIREGMDVVMKLDRIRNEITGGEEI